MCRENNHAGRQGLTTEKAKVTRCLTGRTQQWATDDWLMQAETAAKMGRYTCKLELEESFKLCWHKEVSLKVGHVCDSKRLTIGGGGRQEYKHVCRLNLSFKINKAKANRLIWRKGIYGQDPDRISDLNVCQIETNRSSAAVETDKG